MVDENSSDEERFEELVRLFRVEHDRDVFNLIRAARRQRMRMEFNGIFDEEYASAPHAEEFEICADMARELIGVLHRKYDSLPGRLKDRGLAAPARIATMQRAREHLGELMIEMINVMPYRDWGRPAK
jgi:hypothetical protein